MIVPFWLSRLVRNPLHPVQHLAQRDCAGDFEQRCFYALPIAFALSQSNPLPIVGRPRQAQDGALTLSRVQTEDESALQLDWRHGHERFNVLWEPDDFATIRMVKPTRSA
jgi:hypothetical protein